MNVGKIDYLKLRDKAVWTDVIIIDSLMIIFLFSVFFGGTISSLSLLAVCLGSMWLAYYYKISISKYLDSLDDDVQDSKV